MVWVQDDRVEWECNQAAVPCALRSNFILIWSCQCCPNYILCNHMLDKHYKIISKKEKLFTRIWGTEGFYYILQQWGIYSYNETKSHHLEKTESTYDRKDRVLSLCKFLYLSQLSKFSKMFLQLNYLVKDYF